VHVSIDFVGAVESVDGDPIVTQFVFAGALPIPLKSLYISGTERETVESQKAKGFPLARFHRKSLVFALIRVLGVFCVAACVVIVIGMLEGPPSWRPPGLAMGLAVALALDAAVVGATYLVGRSVSERDRAIRRAGRAVLGVAADLAFVEPTEAKRAGNEVEIRLASSGLADWKARLESLESFPRELAAPLLVRARALLADPSSDRPRLEEITDRLVALLPQG